MTHDDLIDLSAWLICGMFGIIGVLIGVVWWSLVKKVDRNHEHIVAWCKDIQSSMNALPDRYVTQSSCQTLRASAQSNVEARIRPIEKKIGNGHLDDRLDSITGRLATIEALVKNQQ